MTSAVVVGAGPNGLAAAVRLARHGIEVDVFEASDHIGGGTRTSELTVPGVLHDHCSAFHPMGVGSPYLRTLGLERHGLRWRWPEIDCAHPLDSGDAGLLWRSVDETASGLGPDGDRWRRTFGTVAHGFDALADDLMRPMAHVPEHPIRLAVRSGSAAARVDHRSPVAHRQGAGVVRRCRGAHVRAAAPADVVGDRPHHHRRRSPSRLARRRGRVAGHHRRARTVARRARWQDPHWYRDSVCG